MPATNYLLVGLLAHNVFWPGSFQAPRSIFAVLALTLAAAAADQLAAPILQTTSPLWATFAFLLLVWRRGKAPLPADDTALGRFPSTWRLASFIAIHLVVVLTARSFTSAAQPFSGTATVGGTLVAVWKLAVLAPTVLLLPLSCWKELLRAYAPEAKAALVVLLVNVPRRTLEGLWPWYGQVLGRFVYILARFLVPGLGYEPGLDPTLIGPVEDTTIVLMCSGIGSFELLGYLFGFVALLDWNRLRKGRTLLIYFGAHFAVLLSNALRVALFVVLANRGFADFVSGFHLAAGSIFFSFVFLVYLSLTYRWMAQKGDRFPTVRTHG